MQITNIYQKYQSRSNQELENKISYVVHQFKKQNYKHLRVYSHFFNYYRLVPKSTYYKYVVYVTNDHTLEERIL